MNLEAEMISIEKATDVDAEEMIKCKIDAFREEVILYGFGPPDYDSLEELIKLIKEENYFKILDNEKIIGGIRVRDNGEGQYWIGTIYIYSTNQNNGIGTKVMNLLFNEFEDSKKWYLETSYLSFRNQHFYEKMGFVKFGETKPDVRKNGFHLYKYEKIMGK
jgi:RimJ/RimL family protein N-acetyltransferase